MSSYSRSTHPPMVHFPIAFIVTTQILDLIYGLTTHPSTAAVLKARLFDATPYLTDIVRLSYLLNILGLLSAIPAVISGGIELAKMMQAQDVPAKLKKANDKAAVVKRAHPKLKMAFAHALINDLVLVAAGYNWWTRRSTPMNAPTDINVLLSAITLPLFGGAGYLGATLVYEHGVGVNVRKFWGGGATSKEE